MEFDPSASETKSPLSKSSGSSSSSYTPSSHDSDSNHRGMLFGSSEAAKQFSVESERGSAFDSSGAEITLFAILKAATGGGSITFDNPPPGLKSELGAIKPTLWRPCSSHFSSSSLAESDTKLSEEDEKQEKMRQLRVKFLRLVHRLCHSPEDSMVREVLYGLTLVSGRQTNQQFDAEVKTARELEVKGKNDMDISLNILVLGKTGVGKSATINSIFKDVKSPIHAYEPATTSVREITGMVEGIKTRVIDCPGLKSSDSEQGLNRKVLSSVEKLIKKYPPDIVLYVDRLDTYSRDRDDLPLLKSITSSLGSSIWRNAIVTLTHADSKPPDGPSGSPLSYEVFVAQRSRVVLESIGQSVGGDLQLMNSSLFSPVSLVENHSNLSTREGEKVPSNAQTWRPRLLLMCFSMKILSETISLSKPQDPVDHPECRPEVRLKEADYPIGQDQFSDYPIGQDQLSLGLSLLKWGGDMKLGANLQSQISVGRSYKVAVRAGLNNKMSGQISVRTSSFEQFQIALIGLLPIATWIFKCITQLGRNPKEKNL